MTKKTFYRGLLCGIASAIAMALMLYAVQNRDRYLKEFLLSSAAAEQVPLTLGSVNTILTWHKIKIQLNQIVIGSPVDLQLRTISADIDIIKTLRTAKLQVERISLDGATIATKPAAPTSTTAITAPIDGTPPQADVHSFIPLLSLLTNIDVTNAIIVIPALGKNEIKIDQLTVTRNLQKGELDVNITFYFGANKTPINFSGTIETNFKDHVLGKFTLSCNHNSLPANYLSWINPDLIAIPTIAVKKLFVIGKASWDDATWTIALDKIDLDSDAVAAVGSLNISGKRDVAPEFNMNFAIARTNTAILTYLPATIMGTDVHHWLKTNLLSAEVDKGQLNLRIKNNVATDFNLALQVRSGELTFLEHWPSAKIENANILINLEGLTATIPQATLAMLNLSTSKVLIGFGDGLDQEINVSTSSTASITAFLQCIEHLPISEKLSFLSDWIGREKGTGKLDLVVAVPLNSNAPPTLQGRLKIDDLQITNPRLAHLGFDPSSTLVGQFDLNKFVLEKLSTHVSGQSLTASGTVNWADEAKGATGDFNFSGVINLNTLQTALPAIIASHGTGHYAGKFAFVSDQGTFEFSSQSTVTLRDPIINIAKITVGTGAESLTMSVEMSGDDKSAAIYIKNHGSLVGLAGVDFAQPAQLRATVSSHEPILALPVKPGTISLDLDNIKGTIQLGSTWADGPHKIELKKLSLNDLKAIDQQDTAVASSPVATKEFNGKLEPTDLPAIEFSCAELNLFGLGLHDVYLSSEKSTAGITIKNFRTDRGSFSIYNATGSFLKDTQGLNHVVLNGSYIVRDFSKLGSDLAANLPVLGGYGNGIFHIMGNSPTSLGGSNGLVIRSSFKFENLHLKSMNDHNILKMLNLLTLNILSSGSDEKKIDSLGGNVSYDGKEIKIADGNLISPVVDMNFAGQLNPAANKIDMQIDMTTKISRTINAIALGLVNPILALGYLGADKEFSGVKKFAGLISLDRFSKYSFELTGDLDHPKIHSTSIPGLF